jgi:cobalamin biosynthesis Mg chelatase CobN
MSTQKPKLWQVIKAVLGAMAGVQSEQQRQQDFTSSSPLPYIITGVIFTLLFVLVLLFVVSWALS